ncbi:hypothetical protein OIU84_021454 [Salix udensis]|uniref:PABS domain-containing protein n=1 Tax=Salix udensis TaxID=889485 RepID=A0AAD6PJ10_9ROSI|nr:hypothetical protein OIU84_021454 [Salix udensis]
MESFKVRKWMNSSTMNLLFIQHFFITQVQRRSLLWEEVRGSTAREILRHKTVEKVVMCDIDEEVVDFCKAHLDVNREAFCDPRLDVIINDARTELEIGKECYDVIIGDLADPIEGGPCYKLYTKSFYEHSVKPKLNRGGIFVTQAGPAGIFSHTEVFSCICNTLRQVFKYVVAYSAHIPSYADTWGWVMASDIPFTLSADELTAGLNRELKGKTDILMVKTFSSASTLSKAVRKSLDNETHVYTEGTARFISMGMAAFRNRIKHKQYEMDWKEPVLEAQNELRMQAAHSFENLLFFSG